MIQTLPRSNRFVRIYFLFIGHGQDPRVTTDAC